MAAPKPTTALRALRTLSGQATPKPAFSRRSLHITGAKSAQPAKGTDLAAIYSSRSTADLRSECERRGLFVGGSKSELASRLANHDYLQTRAFSIAMKRIEAGATFGTSKTSRRFNSDDSKDQPATINLNFMSSLEPQQRATSMPFSQIPVLPEVAGSKGVTGAGETMSQKIYTVAGRSSEVSSPSTVVDHPSDPFTPEPGAEGAETFAAGDVNYIDGRVSSMAKELWQGIVSDVRPSKAAK
ncbi:hypothetical protein KEM55_002269 [Ascosphaera atra]|nr:hypothetical protein KEM55_002269 [Ascosphaera atra]